MFVGHIKPSILRLDKVGVKCTKAYQIDALRGFFDFSDELGDSDDIIDRQDYITAYVQLQDEFVSDIYITGYFPDEVRVVDYEDLFDYETRDTVSNDIDWMSCSGYGETVLILVHDSTEIKIILDNLSYAPDITDMSPCVSVIYVNNGAYMGWNDTVNPLDDRRTLNLEDIYDEWKPNTEFSINSLYYVLGDGVI